MGKTILFGEPMALLIADTTGPLENVEHFTRALSGAEVNVSIGLTRLGHSVEYLTRLGDDPFGHYIAKTLGENQIGISLLSYDSVYRTGIQLKTELLMEVIHMHHIIEKDQQHHIFQKKKLMRSILQM